MGKYIWTALLSVTLVSIFVLTEQSPQQTTALSGAVSSVASGIANAQVSSDEGFVHADEGKKNSKGSFAIFGQGVRRLAHTAEFFFVGFFSLLAARAWRADCGRSVAGGRGRPVLMGVVVVFCVMMSLFDQAHKLLVPGREFDCVDLMMDAIGYLAGIAFAGIGAALWSLFCRFDVRKSRGRG